MNKLDKKQIPQFAALCVLSAGVFGYFVVKIVTPSPAAAGTRPHPATEAAQTATAAAPAPGKAAGTGPATNPAVIPTEDGAEVPAPTPGMRDPFMVGYVDPKTQPALPIPPVIAPAKVAATAKAAMPVKAGVFQVASIREVGPASAGMAALPFGLKGFSPLGAGPSLPSTSKAAEAPKAPVWTVTGVLQSEAGQVAVLRNGEARRIVRTGDFVDSTYQVVAVTRGAVVLRHGKTFYHLALGAAKPTTPARAPFAIPAAALSHVPALSPASKSPSHEPQETLLPPEVRPSGMAQVMQGALLMASSYMSPAWAEVEICLAAFNGRHALPPDVEMRFQDGLAPAPSFDEARARWERSRGLYQNGLNAEDRAQWRCVLARDDRDAADEAGKLLDQYD